MKTKPFFVMCFLALSLFTSSFSSVWAVPLSHEDNLKAIVSKQAGSAGHFDFVVIGDSRDGDKIYERLLDLPKGFKPLFVLNTGDFVARGEPSEYDHYSKQISSYDIPIIYVPGNHDVRSGYETYRKYVGKPNWYFDVGKIRIIGLDNAAGRFSPETVTFLQKALTKKKTCIIAFHAPPAIGRWTVHAMDPNKGNYTEVKDLIRKYNVPLVFLGHIHLYDEMQTDGTTYIISAGGGARLESHFQFGKPEHGLVLIKVGPREITHQWVPLH